MTWIYESNERYGLRLTDGYLMGREIMRRASANGMTPEKAMARHLYRLGRKQSWHPSVVRPDPLHVWIVGQPGWLKAASFEARALSGGEVSDDYRWVIIGEGYAPSSGIYWHAWDQWLRRAGLRQRRRDQRPNDFAERAHRLVSRLRSDLDTGTMAEELLDRYELPALFFCG